MALNPVLELENEDNDDQGRWDDNKLSNEFELEVQNTDSPTETNNRKGGKIIVAEDKLINMQVIKQQMQTLGHMERCEFAFNGEEAIKTIIDVYEDSLMTLTG